MQHLRRHAPPHRKEGGEADERLFVLAAWRDTSYFTDAERAGLALTEAVTRLSEPLRGSQGLEHHEERDTDRVGHPTVKVMVPLVLLGIAAASWVLRSASRTLGAAAPLKRTGYELPARWFSLPAVG